MSESPPREVTREERREIKKLVASMCANYDRQYGCLPLDYGRCYMIDKCWIGSLCKYFREAVLPLNPVLETALTGEGARQPTRTCGICGKEFAETGKQAYCSQVCAAAANREKSKERMAKMRKK